MSRRDAMVFVTSAAVFGLLLVLIVGVANGATPFGYRYLGTVGWVPGSGYVNSSGWNASAVLALDTGVAFGRRPDIIAANSSADWRWFVMSATYLANEELMSTGASVGSVDSLLDGAHVVPAAGKVYYGFMPWLVAPVPVDTLWIDGYEEER